MIMYDYMLVTCMCVIVCLCVDTQRGVVSVCLWYQWHTVAMWLTTLRFLSGNLVISPRRERGGGEGERCPNGLRIVN